MNEQIIVYFLTDRERDAARELLPEAEETDSYLVGEADQATIAALRERKLLVELVEPDGPEETPGAPSRPLRGRAPRAAARRPAPPAAAVPETLPGPDEPDVYLLRLKGPLLEAWRRQLEERGVELLERVPRNSFAVRLRVSDVPEIEGLRFVQRVRRYAADDTGPISPRMAAAGPGAPAEAPSEAVGKRMLTFDVRLRDVEGVPSVLSWLAERDVSVAGSSRRKIRIYALEDSDVPAALAALPQVALVEEYVPPELHNDVARELLGLEEAGGANPAAAIPQRGAGQLVGVADTGLDEDHPDFQDRIAGIVALGRPGDPSDPHGHGTHVAGSVLGDGSASDDGALRGVAPEATLFFQSLLDHLGRLGGLPLDLWDLFEEAYEAGVRVHNNSWGAATGSMYTVNSTEVDEFVAAHRDLLVVISAGNEGTAADPLNAQPGSVDWLSIGSPASSKNALTVGASRTRRTSGGLSGLSYGDAWPDDFPDPPSSDEPISGDPERLAAFSSRGPCDDRRVKPDVVAPGTDVVSAKSSRAPLANFWGPFPGNPRYAYMGGTSMAAPLVAGCAALVRQYFVEERDHEPSAALLKAAIVNGTRRLTGADALAPPGGEPSFHQGFGGVHVPTTIPVTADPAFRLEFRDEWEAGGERLNASGERALYRFSVNPGSPWLRVCLAWTDVPGRALQNNLNLFLRHIESDERWRGNEQLPLSLNIPDPDNNVEVVRVQNPRTGDYAIHVMAKNLLHADQDFALVVTGDLDSDLIPS